MRAFLLCSGAVVVGLLAYVIGSNAVEEAGRVGPRDEVSRIEQAPERPALPLLGGLVEDDRGWLLGDVVVTLHRLDQPAPEITVITDSSGWWSTEVAPGQYRLGVFARDYLPQITEVALPTAEKLVTRVVRGGVAIRGTVLDATGRPLAGARAVIHDGERVAAVAVTSSDGSFTGTVARSYTKVSGHAEGHLDAEVERAEVIVLRLVPGVSLQGVVTRADNEACPEAEVVLDVDQDGVNTRTLTARTDDDGRFELLVPLGDAKLTARGPGCAVSIPLHLHLTGPRSVHVIADAGHQISGRVTVRGSAVRGATVLLSDGHRPSSEMLTDADGMFMFQGIASSIDLTVTHREHLSAATRSLDVTDDLDIAIELPPGRAIRGRIEPAGVATLTVERPADRLADVEIGARSLEGTSAADGTFTLYGAPDGDVVVLAATTDGLRGKVTLASDADRDHVRLSLGAAGSATLTGRVVDDRGAPVAGKQLALSQQGEVRQTTSEADGRFRIDRLVAGPSQLYVEDLDTIAVVLAETADITVVVPRKVAVLRGRVVEGATPVAGVWVSAMPTDAPYASPVQALTGEDGSFELTGLASVPHKLYLPREGELTGETIAEPGRPVAILATRRHTIVVRAMRGGNPMRVFTLSCSSRDGGGFWTMVRSAEGTYRGQLRTGGTITCLAEAGELGAVAIGDGHELDLVFEPLTKVTGQVPPGSRVSYRFGAGPQLNPDSETFLYSGIEVDETGHVLGRIFPGPGTLTLRGEQFRVVRTWSVNGTPGGQIDLGTQEAPDAPTP